jgi:hypothetical protein
MQWVTVSVPRDERVGLYNSANPTSRRTSPPRAKRWVLGKFVLLDRALCGQPAKARSSSAHMRCRGEFEASAEVLLAVFALL